MSLVDWIACRRSLAWVLDGRVVFEDSAMATYLDSYSGDWTDTSDFRFEDLFGTFVVA